MKKYTLVSGNYHGVQYRGLVWGAFESLGDEVCFVRLLEPIVVNGEPRGKIAIVVGCGDTIEPVAPEVSNTQWQVDIPVYQTGEEDGEWRWVYPTQQEAVDAAVREHKLTREEIVVSEV